MCVLTSACAAISLPASAEPALNPNQPNQRMPGADQRERQRVRRHRVLRPTAPASEDEHRGERGDPGVDVHDGAAGEVERTPLEQPALGREHPVRDRRVDEHRPQPDEPDPRRTSHPVGDRAGDQRRRDDREHHLEAMNANGGIVSARSRWAASSPTSRHATRSRGCRCTSPVPPNASEYTTTAQRTLTMPRAEEVLHEHAEHVLGPDHAAVEQARGPVS